MCANKRERIKKNNKEVKNSFRFCIVVGVFSFGKAMTIVNLENVIQCIFIGGQPLYSISTGLGGAKFGFWVYNYCHLTLEGPALVRKIGK